MVMTGSVAVPSVSIASAMILVVAAAAAADWTIWSTWAVRSGDGGSGSGAVGCDELPRSLWQWMRVPGEGEAAAMEEDCAADESSLFSLSFWRVLLSLGAMSAPRVTALSMWSLDRRNTLLLMRALQGCVGFGLEMSHAAAFANFVGHFLCFCLCPSFLFLIPALQLRSTSPVAAALVTVSTLVLGTCESVASILYVFGQHAHDMPTRGVVTVRLVDERYDAGRRPEDAGVRGGGNGDGEEDGDDADADADGEEGMAGVVIEELEVSSSYMSSDEEDGDEGEGGDDDEDDSGSEGSSDDDDDDDDDATARPRAVERSRSASSAGFRTKLTSAAGLLRMWLLVVSGELAVFLWLAVMAADIKYFTVPTAKALVSWGTFLTAHLVGVGIGANVSDAVMGHGHMNSSMALGSDVYRGRGEVDDDALPLLSSVMCVEVILAVVFGVIIRIGLWIVMLPAGENRMSRYDSIGNTITHLEASIRSISASLSTSGGGGGGGAGDDADGEDIFASFKFPPAIDIPEYYVPSDERFRCPITMMPMAEPALATSSGITYERSALETWMRRHNREPMTRRRLRRCMSTDNSSMSEQHERPQNASSARARADEGGFDGDLRQRATSNGGNEDESSDADVPPSSCACAHIVPNLALRGMIEDDVDRSRAQHLLLLKKIFAKRESTTRRRKRGVAHTERRRKKTRADSARTAHSGADAGVGAGTSADAGADAGAGAGAGGTGAFSTAASLSSAWPALKDTSMFVSTLGIFETK